MEGSVRQANRFGLLILIIFTVGSMILSPILMGLGLKDLSLSFIVYLVLMFIPTLLFAIPFKRHDGVSLATTLNIKPLDFKSLLLIIGFAITIQPLMNFISSFSSLFFTNTLNDYVKTLVELPLPILLVTLAILPAFFEEIPTRGLLLYGYKDVDIRVAAIINGLVFGFLHLNFQQFTYAFLLGALFVYLVRATGSVLASITAHFVINGSQAVMMKVQYALYGDEVFEIAENISTTDLLLPVVFSLFIALIITPLAYLCLRTLFRIHGKEHLLPLKQSPSHMYLFKKPVMITFYVTVVIFILLGIIVELSKFIQ